MSVRQNSGRGLCLLVPGLTNGSAPLFLSESTCFGERRISFAASRVVSNAAPGFSGGNTHNASVPARQNGGLGWAAGVLGAVTAIVRHSVDNTPHPDNVN
jgi:hypothetical protein